MILEISYEKQINGLDPGGMVMASTGWANELGLNPPEVKRLVSTKNTKNCMQNSKASHKLLWKMTKQ